MLKPSLKKKLIFLFLILQVSTLLNAQQLSYSEMELDNPWLCLKAIKNAYPDITGDIFFDEQVGDWCLKIRGINFYWAHGRMLKKAEIKKWQSWQPFISYYYENNPRNPKYYTKELIEKLKPKSLIQERRDLEFPNYSFHQVVYEGASKKQIIKQLRVTWFLGKKIWVHKRVAKAVKNVEKRIIEASKTDPATRNFLKTLTYCWCFNWRAIKDSGKLSNHSWGTAIDVAPKDYQQHKIYWYWEASKNNKWMLIPPERRWSPSKKVIEAFQAEGFIWGGNWHIWDTMHFEYRPELLYISQFINSSSKENIAILKKENKTENSIDKKSVKEFIAKGDLLPVIQVAEKFYCVKNISEDYVNKKTGENYYTKVEEVFDAKGNIVPLLEITERFYCIKNISENYISKKTAENDASKIGKRLRAKGNIIPIFRVAERFYCIKNISENYINKKINKEYKDD